MREFNPAYPYNYNRLYGSEKYNLQNMLLKQVNFPRYYSDEDKLYDIWSDRVYTEWMQADRLIDTNQTGDAWYAGATDKSFLRFASEVFSLINKEPIELTGAALVRYTNVSNGYPCLYLMGIVMSPEKRNMGYPLIQQRQDWHTRSMYGDYGLYE